MFRFDLLPKRFLLFLNLLLPCVFSDSNLRLAVVAELDIDVPRLEVLVLRGDLLLDAIAASVLGQFETGLLFAELDATDISGLEVVPLFGDLLSGLFATCSSVTLAWISLFSTLTSISSGSYRSSSAAIS